MPRRIFRSSPRLYSSYRLPLLAPPTAGGVQGVSAAHDLPVMPAHPAHPWELLLRPRHHSSCHRHPLGQPTYRAPGPRVSAPPTTLPASSHAPLFPVSAR